MSAPSFSAPTDALPSADEVSPMWSIFADGPFDLEWVFDPACEGEATP
jgi:hypothetical protein